MELIVNPHKIEIDKSPVNEREIDITKCKFEFADEITSDYVKEAYFTFDGTTYKQIIVNNECNIPSEVLTKKGQIEVGVVAFLVENEEEIKRYNPSPAYFNTWVGSLKDNVENSEPITPTDKEQIEQAIQDMETQINNLDIEAEKTGNTTTITITKKDGTQETVEIFDGIDGVGIEKIEETSTSGLVDTYTITFTDGNTTTFDVTNGNGIISIVKTSTVDNVDTYTITYTNGTTSTFTVTNSTVTNQEFEDLKAKHERLINTLPKVEGTGENLIIENTAEYNMNVVLNPSELSQEGTPTIENPIPIKKITGDNIIEVSGKNLYDESKITDVSTYRATATINNDKSITITSTGTNGYAIIRPFFNFKANETYTVSFNVDNISNYNHMYLFINASTTGGGYSKNPYVTITKTTDSLLGIGIYPNANATITISNIQIEKNTSKTLYEPYNGQIFPINLGTLEYCKIGNYADSFYLDSGNWYIRKNIGKIDSYNGETITTQYISTTGGLDTGATVYYVLETSQDELITDTTLINQLNDFYNNVSSYKGQTDITQTNAELPFNINAIALYDLNNLITRVATLETEV